MIDIDKTKDWNGVRRLMREAPGIVRSAAVKAFRWEAHNLRRHIVMGIKRQAPGGSRFKKHSPLTKRSRRIKLDKKGPVRSKILQERGDLVNGISVLPKLPRTKAFIGVPRKTRKSDGNRLVDIAQIHEFGSQPIVIKITPAMRRFLAVLFKNKRRKKRRKSKGRGVVVIQIPERPFLRPAFKQWAKFAEQRFKKRMHKNVLDAARKRGIAEQYFGPEALT